MVRVDLAIVFYGDQIYAHSIGFFSVSHVSSSFTSLTLALSTRPGFMANSYTISYSNTNTDCFESLNGIDAIHGTETVYTLTSLQEGTEYTINVTAVLSNGKTAGDSLSAITLAAG